MIAINKKVEIYHQTTEERRENMQANKLQTDVMAMSAGAPHDATRSQEEFKEAKPEIIPLHVSCSQRPDWSCGPCKAPVVK